MGFVHTEITLKNVNDMFRAKEGLIPASKIRQTTVSALVDTGAWTLAINEATRAELGLEIVGNHIGKLANGVIEEYNLAGPVEVRWKDRRVVCEPLVVPTAGDILLGAIPMEAMDLIISPRMELVGAHGDIIIHRV